MEALKPTHMVAVYGSDNIEEHVNCEVKGKPDRNVPSPTSDVVVTVAVSSSLNTHF